MKVLLLEDNKFDADLAIRAIHEKIPHAIVHNAKTIAEALESLKLESNYSLALLDINLPDGNGLEVLVDIHRKKLPITSIVLTSIRDEEQAVTALKSGADDYFIKDPENYSKLPELMLHNILAFDDRKNKSVELLNVLYLEHHLSDIDLTIRYFKRHAPNIKIEAHDTSSEILEILPISPTNDCKYQLLLMDYNLPGIDVLDLLKELRQNRQLHIPIIIITGQGNEEIAIQTLKLGANDYIVKRDNYLLRLPSLIENAHQHCLLTRQKRSLEESEHRYRLLAENAGDVIFTLDLNLNYTYISPSVYNLRGQKPEELINQSIQKTLTKKSFDKVKNILAEIVNNKESTQERSYNPIIIELEMYRKDQSTIWTEVKASILINESKKPFGILGVTRDITLRKKYEQELITAKEKAEENDRLKSAFLANISHEIRTPMNGILGFSELLKDSSLEPSTVSHYINIIERSGKRMLNTLNDLMDISKIEAGLIEIVISEIDIHELIVSHFNFFQPEASVKNIELTYSLGSQKKKFIIKSDKPKLIAILANLIKNSIKYTLKGSVSFGYFLGKDEIVFFVKDTGIGIAKKHQHKIFERFVQANQDYAGQFEGSGLGLSISKSYINALGGKIWLISEPNIGSTFFFSLPFIHNA